MLQEVPTERVRQREGEGLLGEARQRQVVEREQGFRVGRLLCASSLSFSILSASTFLTSSYSPAMSWSL